MKGKIIFAAVLAVTVLGTACGGKTKTLECTLEQKADQATTTSTMTVKFKGNTAEKITLDMSISYGDEYKEYADVFKQTLEAQRSTLEDVGYEVKITSEDNAQKLTATGTNKTLDKEESTGNYEDTKKKLEDSGYTCK